MPKFQTRLSPSQATKRLQSFFNSRQRFDYAAKKTYEIAGAVKDRTFRFMVKNGLGRRYAFRPNLYGEILENPDADGSTIHYYYKMDRVEKVILLIWSIPLLILTLYFGIKTILRAQTTSLQLNDYMSFGIPLLMLAFTYTWFIISQFMIKDHRKLKMFLREAFKGAIIED